MEGVVTYDGDIFKLTTENYSYWKPMMEDHLYCKDLHELITQKDKSEEKWVRGVMTMSWWWGADHYWRD